jgi:hydroxylaminobenzene mutase
MNQDDVARRLAVLGVALLLAGMVTGLLIALMPNPRLGLSAHLAGAMGGIMLIALAAIWPRVALGRRGQAWAFGLLSFGNVANWATVLVAASWGAGATSMPLAGKGMAGAPWQENLIAAALLALSVAVLAGLALTLRGLLAQPDKAD